MISKATRALVAIASSLVLTTTASAQCPDGGPQPCRAAQAAKPVPVDQNRVAVLPFRVTTADSLLGEGFAELLAPEFTGEGSLRAVDMSTVLAAWRRAGGAPRAPLSQDNAAKLARSLGAGRFVQGSVVGIGSTRLRVEAAVFDATSNATVGNSARATSGVDSIETLVNQLATDLLGAGAQSRIREAARLTRSPAALRSYVEGLALLRRGDFDGAGKAFETSIAVDSTFAEPVFQRWMIASQLLQGGGWGQRVVAVKARLTQRERRIIETQIADPTRPRTVRQAFDERRKLAEELGDSPEMWFMFGDRIFHSSRFFIPGDSIRPMAGVAFSRALALDSSALFMQHNFSVAAALDDTASVRAMMSTAAGSNTPDAWALAWTAATILNDAATLGRLRRSVPKGFSITGAYQLTGTLNNAGSVALADEGFRLFEASAQGQALQVTVMRWMMHRARGRPDAAEQLAQRDLPVWQVPYLPWFWITGDSVDDELVLRRRGAAPLVDSIAEGRRLCVQDRLLAARGRFDSVDTRALRQHRNTRCATILDIWRSFANRALTDSALAALDTVVATGTFSTFLGFEHRLLASIYEARGDTARALWALRQYPRDFPGAWMAPTFREEGRLFLLNRDTTRAIASYKRYLELRAEADPVHIAERDSIRTLVTALARRR